MLSPQSTFDTIKALGMHFFCGVPDSLLKDFCAYVTDHSSTNEHVITANEGNAVAMAVGHYLASGSPAVVYMQNSGIGNAVNPLMSLADKEVYGIPMLLLVGWRGEPGVKDEPQHIKQGRIMEPLVDAMELPQFVLPSNENEAKEIIAKAYEVMISQSCPVVLLVKKGSFSPYKLQSERPSNYPMKREDAIAIVVDQLDEEDIVISTTGMCSRELFEIREKNNQSHDRDFLTVGGMGHTASIALAIAMNRPERSIYCIDGDGSVIMHLGALGIVAQSGCNNLTHIVINNGAHDSVGGQPTVGEDISLTAVALAVGYSSAVSVNSREGIISALNDASSSQQGCSMIEIMVQKGARSDLGRPTTSPAQNKLALMQNLGH